MPRITQRSKLDEYLDNEDFVILVLMDAASAPARAVHGLAVEKVTQPWRKALLLADLAMLTASESDWKAGSDRYAVLGVDGSGTRVVSQAGPIADLMLVDGTPSILAIRQAFAVGEEEE
jgi:hypothetical protein